MQTLFKVIIFLTLAYGASLYAQSRPPDVLICGTTALTTVAAQITATVGQAGQVVFQSDPSNAVNILIGSSTSQPIVLTAGNSIGVAMNSLANWYAKSASSTATINWCATGTR